ncbi:hypothetical protein IWX50DRAFT_652044, partial [Phyllosticta citricarpa]
MLAPALSSKPLASLSSSPPLSSSNTVRALGALSCRGPARPRLALSSAAPKLTSARSQSDDDDAAGVAAPAAPRARRPTRVARSSSSSSSSSSAFSFSAFSASSSSSSPSGDGDRAGRGRRRQGPRSARTEGGVQGMMVPASHTRRPTSAHCRCCSLRLSTLHHSILTWCETGRKGESARTVSGRCWGCGGGSSAARRRGRRRRERENRRRACGGGGGFGGARRGRGLAPPHGATREQATRRRGRALAAGSLRRQRHVGWLVG